MALSSRNNLSPGTDETETPGERTSELIGGFGADLARSIPEAPTVTVELPATVHETPDDEAAVAIEQFPIDPGFISSANAGATASITIATEIADEAADDDEIAVVPLPDADHAYSRKSRVAGRLSSTPEPAEMLTPERLIDSTGKRRVAPEGLWPAFVYAITLHLVNLGDSRSVRERKALDARIDKQFEGSPRFVPVLTRKGGVGKTTVTALMGMAMADAREDRVIAIDANPDRGTLAERVTKQTRSTVRDVVTRAPSIASFTDWSTLVSRDETRLDILASDTDPMLSDAFNEDDYNVVADVAARYYSVILTDCGTGIVHSVMRATLQRADSIVIVSGGSVDEARLASETLTWLESNGYGELVKNAVVALNTSTHGTSLVKLEEIEAHFESRVRAVVRIPYDPQLAAGSVIDFKNLKPLTRSAARELAALVADGLPAQRSS